MCHICPDVVDSPPFGCNYYDVFFSAEGDVSKSSNQFGRHLFRICDSSGPGLELRRLSGCRSGAVALRVWLFLEGNLE